MFPPTSTPAKRSLIELMRDAIDTAIEFATLGEASMHEPAERPHEAPLGRPAPPVPFRDHPHRRNLSRRPARARRKGAIPARVQPCLTPVPPAPWQR